MTSVTVGCAAPDFALAPGPGPDRVTLSQFRGEVVVVLFVPLAFSSTCTAEFCQVRDDWTRWRELEVGVLGISIDSPYVVKRWAEELEVPFPVLSDFNKEAATAFGVLYDDFYGMKGVAKRSAFVVDPSGTVAYAWVSEDAGVVPPFEEVLEAVAALS